MQILRMMDYSLQYRPVPRPINRDEHAIQIGKIPNFSQEIPGSCQRIVVGFEHPGCHGFIVLSIDGLPHLHRNHLAVNCNPPYIRDWFSHRPDFRIKYA
jgi:hypothetical protein